MGSFNVFKEIAYECISWIFELKGSPYDESDHQGYRGSTGFSSESFHLIILKASTMVG